VGLGVNLGRVLNGVSGYLFEGTSGPPVDRHSRDRAAWHLADLMGKPAAGELSAEPHDLLLIVAGETLVRAPVKRAVATLKTWRILFTDYRRPLKTFKSFVQSRNRTLLL